MYLTYEAEFSMNYEPPGLWIWRCVIQKTFLVRISSLRKDERQKGTNLFMRRQHG